MTKTVKMVMNQRLQEDSENGHESKTPRRVKRRKVEDDKRPCVIYNQVKFI